MKAFSIYLDRYDWLIRVYVGVHQIDAQAITQALEDFGCSVNDTRKANKLLYQGAKNTGLCFSNADERISVIVISVTTSAREFFNSVSHEISHLACHIAGEDGVSMYGEGLAYMVGDISFALFPHIRDLLCEHCRKHK